MYNVAALNIANASTRAALPLKLFEKLKYKIMIREASQSCPHIKYIIVGFQEYTVVLLWPPAFKTGISFGQFARLLDTAPHDWLCPSHNFWKKGNLNEV